MEEPSGYVVVRVLGLSEGRRMHLWGSPMRLRMADVYEELECDAVDILHVLFGERERLLAFNAGPLKGYSFNKFTQNEVIYVVLIKKPEAGSFLTFGSPTSPFGWHQHAGSRGTFYAVTEDEEGGVSGQTGKLMCISAMTAYKNKSAEELRWEDYQAGYKGSASPTVQQLAAGSFGQAASSTPFGGTPTFSMTPTPNPFGASIFGSKPAGLSAIGPFPSPFGTFSSVSAFGPASTPAFGSGISPPIETGSTSSFASGFGISSSAFGSVTPAFSSVDGFSSPSNMFNAGSGEFGSNLFGQSQMTGASFSTSNQLFGVSASTLSTPTFGSSIFGSSVSPFQLSKPAGLSQPGASISGAIQSNPVLQQTMGSFSFPSPGLSRPAASAFGAPSIPEAGLSMSTQQPSVPVPISNPFGSLPATPQMSNGHSAGTGPSVKFGISSLPLSERSTQVQTTSLQNPRNITRSRVRVQARQYHPNKNSPKVFFFSDDEETPNTPKVEAFCTGQRSDLHRDANSSPILSVLIDIRKLLTEVCDKLRELKPTTVAIESLNTRDMTATSSGNTEV